MTSVVMAAYCGRKVVVQQPVTVKTKRTWKTRLLSFPWEPWRAFEYKIEEPLKDGQVIQTPDSFIMNRGTWEELKRYIKTTESKFPS